MSCGKRVAEVSLFSTSDVLFGLFSASDLLLDVNRVSPVALWICKYILLHIVQVPYFPNYVTCEA